MDSLNNVMGSTSPNIGVINTLPKKWDEATVEEKIEKLKAEMHDYSSLTNRIVELERQNFELRRHTHVDGKVVVSIEPGVGMVGGFSGPSTSASRRSYLQ